MSPARTGRRGPFVFRLFVTIGWLLVVATAFGLGYFLASYDAERAMAQIQSLQTERDRLSETLAAERQAQTRLERTHLIDREAQRAVQAELAELQGERLRLAKQVTYLQGLMRDEGKGVIEVKEFVLSEGEESGTYDYRFSVNQLVPEFGRSKGKAVVKVAVEQDAGTKLLPLSDLPGSSSGEHPLDFDYFQSVSGTIRIPADLTPQQVVVDIQPVGDNLLASSDAFIWHVQDGRALLLPPAPSVDEDDAGTEPAGSSVGHAAE